MLNLAFIGSEAEAERYGSITNRIDGAKWFAFVPLDRDHSSKGRELLGVTVVEKSIEALLKHHPNMVDAIVIHAQSGFLQDIVIMATQSKIPILAGPLLARNTEELNAMAMELEQEFLVPSCPWRFVPAIQSVKTSIDAGNLGESGLVRMHHWNSGSTDKSYDIPSTIIPDIDIAVWLFGEQPTKIVSLQSPAVDEYIQIHLHFGNGGMAVIDETGALPDGGDYFSLTMIGGTGAAYADDHRNMNLVVDGVHPHAIRTGQGAINIARQLQDFVNIVNGNSLPSFTLQDVSKVLQISDAVLAAIASNKVSVWEDGEYVSC